MIEVYIILEDWTDLEHDLVETDRYHGCFKTIEEAIQRVHEIAKINSVKIDDDCTGYSYDHNVYYTLEGSSTKDASDYKYRIIKEVI